MRVRWNVLIKKLAQFIQRNEIWLAVPICLLLLFPSPWMVVGFVSAIVLWFIRWIATGSPVPISHANASVLVFLVMVTIGFATSRAPDIAVIVAGQTVASLTVFFVLLDHIHVSGDLWQIAAGLVLLGIFLAFVAPFTVTWDPNKLFGLAGFYNQTWPHIPKDTNPNILAGALAPIVPISLAMLVRNEYRLRTLGAVALAPILVMLALLQSRGALFALAVGIALWVTLYRRWVLPLLLIGLLAFLIINDAMGGPTLAQLLYGDINTPTALSTNSFVQRQDLWVQSLFLIRQHPLFGIGLGAYTQVAPSAWPYSAAHPGPVQNHTHNLFLQIALDTGVIGLAAFVVLLFYAFRSAWRASSRGINADLAIGVLAGLTVIVVHGMGDVIVWGTSKSSMVLWVLFALAIKLGQQVDLPGQSHKFVEPVVNEHDRPLK